MRKFHRISSMQRWSQAQRRAGRRIGFVPTMGALHDGHLALVRRCRRENDLVVMSVFVNPIQFAPGEDLDAYPRDKKRDILLAEGAKVDIMFFPTREEMFPPGYATYVDVEGVSSVLCGASRPGHFRGVATVVAKLLHIVQPDTLYLGRKDYQQCVVLKRMIRDLDFPVRVRTVPTVREPDGLAMSSRNRYLDEGDRRRAVVLHRSLLEGRRTVRAGERDAGKILRRIRRRIEAEEGRIDYIVCVDPSDLKPVKRIHGRVLVAAAVKWGRARLIDNMIFNGGV